jgi:hypothetical protein
MGLIDFLIEHRSEGDSELQQLNIQCSSHCNHTKTGKMCKTKWSGVCLLVFSFNPPLINGDIYFQIQSTYNLIETYRNQSGVSWDNEHRAGIDELSASVWAEYMAIKMSNLAWFCLCANSLSLQSHTSMHPFCNVGWIHYSKVQSIMPGHAKGVATFQLSMSIPPSTSVPAIPVTPTTATGDVDSTMMDSIEPPPAPHPTSVLMTKSKNSKQKYTAIATSSISVNMTTIPTALSDKSDKKVKLEQKAVQLDMVSQAVTLNNMQETINHLTDAFEKSMVPPQEAAVGWRGDTLEQLQE